MPFRIKMLFRIQLKIGPAGLTKNNSVQKKQFPFRNGSFRDILVHFGLILGQFGSKCFWVQNILCKRFIHRSALPGRTHKKHFEWKNNFEWKMFFWMKKQFGSKKTKNLISGNPVFRFRNSDSAFCILHSVFPLFGEIPLQEFCISAIWGNPVMEILHFRYLVKYRYGDSAFSLFAAIPLWKFCISAIWAIPVIGILHFRHLGNSRCRNPAFPKCRIWISESEYYHYFDPPPGGAGWRWGLGPPSA